jgi:aryl-alcohol dehydrogenase-like predicted oxidoreductase
MISDSMPHRRLGGLSVSIVGLGCNNFSPGGRVDAAETRAVIDAALDAGINLLDTADTYGGAGGSETLIGEALRGRRDSVVLATKFGSDMAAAPGYPGGPRGSREYIRWAVEGSLRRLQTSVIDLYQYHWPDGVTPIAETLGALDELVDEGKVRFIGCSNVTAAALAEAAEVAAREGLASYVSLQNEYSLLNRALETDVLPECDRLGVSVLPYFPLANGLLTGKYRRGEDAPEGTRLAAQGGALADAPTFARLEALAGYAAERGLAMSDVAIGALTAHPRIASVIAGATRPEQVRANARAARWTPGREDLAALDEIFPPAPPAVAPPGSAF